MALRVLTLSLLVACLCAPAVFAAEGNFFRFELGVAYREDELALWRHYGAIPIEKFATFRSDGYVPGLHVAVAARDLFLFQSPMGVRGIFEFSSFRLNRQVTSQGTREIGTFVAGNLGVFGLNLIAKWGPVVVGVPIFTLGYLEYDGLAAYTARGVDPTPSSPKTIIRRRQTFEEAAQQKRYGASAIFVEVQEVLGGFLRVNVFESEFYLSGDGQGRDPEEQKISSTTIILGWVF